MCGCDIHLYMEYANNKQLEKEKNGELCYNGEPIKAYWKSFGGHFYPGRNYSMFGILSKGVRYDNENGFEPKGMPDFDSLSYEVREDYCMFITDKKDHEGKYCTMKDAMKWANGKYFGSKLYYRNPTDDKPTWVSHPDWHSHSWLSTEEYEKAIQIYKELVVNEMRNGSEFSLDDIILPEYEALLASMKSLEKQGETCRIVFWFDN